VQKLKKLRVWIDRGRGKVRKRESRGDRSERGGRHGGNNLALRAAGCRDRCVTGMRKKTKKKGALHQTPQISKPSEI